ncbi:MAG TPA: CARDB domain-containing protein, partial [Mycobacterium sp.]|nr:CARDB domain-containing protein [Mycobacterium sp.]
IKAARFVDQLIISPGGFSGGGDSGSLIVTDDGSMNPVALLFAGSASVTIANRIDLVLNRFGVAIDGFNPPTGPFTDVAVTSVSAPASVVLGDTAAVTVTVKNFGNQDVASSFDVNLRDATDSVTVGTRSVAGLAVGASATVTFAWTSGSTGAHSLVASHTLTDDRAPNNQNSTTVTVKPQLTDVAVTRVSAPGSVTQDHSINVAVTVGNVGNQNVGTGFVVTLQDSTAGVTLGSQTVPGLAVGASATLTFGWNTSGAVLGNHTLVATHNLTDATAANNQRSVVVAVNAQVTDVAVTSLTAPASVTQGSAATIGLTVQNVGQQDVIASFDVVLTDSTAGVTIGSQTVTGLTTGASATLTFSWNTTGAALGSHTLVATQSLTDANAANNQRSAAVTVNAQVTDIALTRITGPAAVTQGDTAHIGVTVQNPGGVAVSADIPVVLTDATAGVTIATQTVPGLAAGAGATLDFPWNTAGAAISGHTLIARQTLADNNSSNDAGAIGVTVDAPSVHVGNLTGGAVSNGTTWTASVVVIAHDSRHNLVNGVLVEGSWGGSNTGSCVTGEGGGAGTCTIVYASIPNSDFLVSFAVSGLTCTGYVYKSGANHDPDGSSNGTTIFVRRP